MYRILILLTFAAALPLAAQRGSATPRKHHFSQNKKFSAEISTATLDKALLTVYRHEKETVEQVWSRSLTDDREDPNRRNTFPPFQLFQNIEATVADDGSAVALFPPYSYGSGTFALKLITRKGGEQSFWMDQINEHVEDARDSPYGLATTFQLFFESQNPTTFGMWFRSAKQWLVIGLEDFTIRKPEAALIEKLEAVALLRAREMIRENRPTALKKVLRPVLEFAAEYIPAVNPGPRSQYLTRQVEAAYRFLGHQKKPEDKELIEALLEGELTMTTSSDGMDELDSRSVNVGLYSQSRSLGDELLSGWEGKQQDAESGGFDNNRKGNYFVSLSGMVKLPFAAPTNSHAIWIFLIPNHLEEADWSSDEDVLKIQFNPNSGMFGSNNDKPLDHLGFSFNNILAGEYRLKALWDRRPPFAALPKSPDEAILGLPTPGDYESAESNPFKLAAGQHAENIVLECTNRVGEAENYFAADEIWKKRNPAMSSLAALIKPHYGWSHKILLDRPVSDWTASTNFAAPGVHVQKVQLISYENPTDDSSGRALRVTVRTPWKDPRSRAPWRATLVDEHGCTFQSYNSFISGSSHSVYFRHVPFGAREIRFEFVELPSPIFGGGSPPRSQEEKLLSVVLNNLCDVKPESWVPEELPAQRQLGDVTVELTTFDPAAYEGNDEYFLPQHPHLRESGMHPRAGWKPNQFSFSGSANAAQGWRRISGKLRDRWGNEARSLDGFCKEETIFKFEAVFARDPFVGEFEASEKLEVPIPKIPGPGESIAINEVHFLRDIPIQIHAISGPGEFYYYNGVPVHGEKEISNPDHQNRFHHDGPIQSLVVTDKLYQAKTAANGTLIPDRSIVVAARGPHLSFRAPILPRDTMLLVAEQDQSMADPIHSPDFMSAIHTGDRPREWRLIPLKFAPDGKESKITFTVQKPHTAEFILRVPKRSPQNSH